MFEYRQVLSRMRLGDTDRAIARAGLMGRRKVARLRRTAETEGWLDAATPLPGDSELAGHLGSARPQPRGRLAGRTASRADHALVASWGPGHPHPRRPGTQPRLHRLVLLGAPLPRSPGGPQTFSCSLRDSGAGPLTVEGSNQTKIIPVAEARSVVYSLWLVDDVSTRKLMAEFYAHFGEPGGNVAALAKAQRAT